MAKIAVTKEFHFSMGHALWLYEGKCFNLHGHNYKAQVTVTATEGLNELGFVIDFAEIKALVAETIDEQWDHKTLVNKDDPRFNDKLPGVLKVPWNPTAENLAAAIFRMASNSLQEYPVEVTRVVLWETESAFAEINA